MLVSVIIPTHNRSGKVFRALDSVLRQSFQDFEVIVVDDGSTDDTSFWMSFYSDSKLKYIQQQNKGVAAARNLGVQKAEGQWICFLDSDDVWHRHKLSEQVRFHDQNRGCLFSQTDDIWIRNSVRVNKMKKHDVREGDIFKESLKMCLVCCSSVMVQKKLFQDVGGFDESLRTCEDYDLWLRLLVDHPVGFVNKRLVSKFGGHEDQLSKKYEAMDRYRLLALKKILGVSELKQNQKKWVEEEIQIKESIVLQGELKRKKSYETI